MSMVTQAGAGTATRLRPRNNWPIERWAGSPSASAACSSAVARYRPNSHCNRPSASARHHPSVVRSPHPPGMPSPVERRASSASVPVADSSNSSTPAAAPGRSQANTRTNGAAESFGGADGIRRARKPATSAAAGPPKAGSSRVKSTPSGTGPSPTTTDRSAPRAASSTRSSSGRPPTGKAPLSTPPNRDPRPPARTIASNRRGSEIDANCDPALAWRTLPITTFTLTTTFVAWALASAIVTQRNAVRCILTRDQLYFRAGIRDRPVAGCAPLG